MMMTKRTVLVVDDLAENISVLVKVLGDQYQVKVALNGPKAIQIAQAPPPSGPDSAGYYDAANERI